MIFRGYDTTAAAGGDAVHLRGILEQLANDAAAVPPGINDAANLLPQVQPVPPHASGRIQGVDGKFIIDITNPQDINPITPTILQQRALQDMNAAGTPIYHRLTSATNKLFDASASVTVYPISTATHYEFQLPNQTLFWTLESSYDGANWNTPMLYVDPASCGVVSVWSGLNRNSSDVLNNAASTPTGTNPLTQHGTSTQIDVAASVWKCGDQTLTYSPGSVDPGVLGLWYVYAKDQKRTGGTVTFIATQTVSDITSDNSNIYFGKITTAGGGGGSGSGGGSGPCHVEGTLITCFDGSKKDIALAKRGDSWRGIDGGEEIVQSIEMEVDVPCFRVEFKNGIVLRGCSSGEPLKLAGGGFVPAFEAHAGDKILTEKGASAIKLKKYIGNKTVYKPKLNRTFGYWADGTGCHNVSK